MVRHYALTLSGSQQNVATALASQFASPDEGSRPIRYLSFQAKGANAALAYIGGSGQVLSSSVYMSRVEIPVTSIPAAPTMFEFSTTCTNLGQWSVLGTNTEVLLIGTLD
jgi:hypothetical protein